MFIVVLLFLLLMMFMPFSAVAAVKI